MAVGRPSRFPFARAFRNPAQTRSTMSDRSSSARAANPLGSFFQIACWPDLGSSRKLRAPPAVCHRFSMSIQLQHLCHPHGPADQIRVRDDAMIEVNFLFMNQDEAIVLNMVAISGKGR